MSISRSSITQLVLFYTALILLGLNLRPIMAAIGPLLETLQHDVGVTDIQGGLLTTIPVFMMGAVAFLGGAIQARIGIRTAILMACALIALGNGLRWVLVAPVWLLCTAALGGIGIAVIQALMPAFIKQYPIGDSGRGMALFTTGIMSGAAIAACTAAPIAAWAGWPLALAVWVFLALAAASVWFAVAPRGKPVDGGGPTVSLPWRSPRAWLLMAFFGIGTAAYTLILAWLPPFFVNLGWSASSSGLLLGALTVCEVISGLTLSSVIAHFPDRRRLLATVLSLACISLAALLLAPEILAIPAIIVMGFAIGSLFPLALIVSLDHVDDPTAAGSLMGFVQGGGYILASLMPLAAGMIRSALSSLDAAWIVMIVALLIQLTMVPALRPGDRLVPGSWHRTRRASAESGVCSPERY